MKIYYYTNLDIESQSFADRDVLSVEDLARYKDVGTLSASLQNMKPDAAMRDMNITEAAKKFKSKVTLDIQEDDTSYRYRSLMAKPQLVLKFSLPIYVEIPVGAWCEYQGETFSLNTPQNIKKNGNRNIEYTLNMGTAQDNMSLYKIRNSVDKRLKFSICAKPHEFIEEIVKNLNERDGAGKWKVGTCIDANEKTIEFNHTYIDAALSQVAETFETEWEVDNYTINLCKVEYFKESPLPLSYGKGNGFMPGVGRTTPSNEMPIKRLYVQGGDKNIDRSKYGSAELLLPKSQTLEYEGRTYQSDADGFYIERIDKISDAVKEDSLDCSECYPSRVGAVTSVIAVKPEKNFYDFTDTSIPADLNFNDYIIEGETATIIFQSGMLAGKEFEFKYKHNERRFEIVPQEIDGQVMPNETFIPAVGNTYAIFGIMLPESYICNNEAKEGASWDMFREAARHMYENEDQKFTFQGTLQSLYAKRNWVNIGGKLKVGGYVHFSDTQFAKDGVDIRITGIKDYLTSPYSPTVEISNSVTGQSLTSKLREIDSQEVVIEDNHKAAIQFTKRRFRDAQETISMLEGALDNFSESINPITVQTMAMLVGDESLQFRFVKDKRSAIVVPFNVYYNDEMKQLIINQIYYLQHLTIDINTITSGHTSDEYKTWEMNTFASARLDNADKKYYLYAKVSKDISKKGDFLLSETVIDMYKEDGYYYLLVGILNSEYEETRSFVELYGYTEILPGRITVDKIVSTDGKTFFDLANSIIGGKIDFQDGLISGLIELGNELGVNAGLSGDGTEATDIRIWAGAKKDNRENAPFRVLHNGKLYASDADIEGKVTAGSGDDKIVISASSGEGQVQLSEYGKVGYEKNVSYSGQFGMTYGCDKTGILRLKAIGGQAGSSGQMTEIMGCAVQSPNVVASTALLSSNLSIFFGQAMLLGKNFLYVTSSDGGTLSAQTEQGDCFFFGSSGGTLQLPLIASLSRIIFVATTGTVTLSSIPTYTPVETYANIYANGENKGRSYTIRNGAFILVGLVNGWFLIG